MDAVAVHHQTGVGIGVTGVGKLGLLQAAFGLVTAAIGHGFSLDFFCAPVQAVLRLLAVLRPRMKNSMGNFMNQRFERLELAHASLDGNAAVYDSSRGSFRGCPEK